MANTVEQVEYYYTKVANRPGEGTRVLNALKGAGVNLLAYTGFPASATRAQLDFVPSDKTPSWPRRGTRGSNWWAPRSRSFSRATTVSVLSPTCSPSWRMHGSTWSR